MNSINMFANCFSCLRSSNPIVPAANQKDSAKETLPPGLSLGNISKIYDRQVSVNGKDWGISGNQEIGPGSIGRSTKICREPIALNRELIEEGLPTTTAEGTPSSKTVSPHQIPQKHSKVYIFDDSVPVLKGLKRKLGSVGNETGDNIEIITGDNLQEAITTLKEKKVKGLILDNTAFEVPRDSADGNNRKPVADVGGKLLQLCIQNETLPDHIVLNSDSPGANQRNLDILNLSLPEHERYVRSSEVPQRGRPDRTYSIWDKKPSDIQFERFVRRCAETEV